MKDAFKSQATIEAVSTRKDKSCKIVIGTQELSADEKAKLFSLEDFGWFIFAPFEAKEIEIPPSPKSLNVKKGKSVSKRLRDVIYVYFESISDDTTPEKFQTFYEGQIEYLINKYKEKI